MTQKMMFLNVVLRDCMTGCSSQYHGIYPGTWIFYDLDSVDATFLVLNHSMIDLETHVSHTTHALHTSFQYHGILQISSYVSLNEVSGVGVFCCVCLFC